MATAPLLSDESIRQCSEIASLIRNRQVAILAGAGVSFPSGLPLWPELLGRLLIAWKQWDSSPLSALDDEAYREMLPRVLSSELACISFIRKSIPVVKDLDSLGQLVYAASYSTGEQGEYIPQPNNIHRHLVAIANASQGRIWTSNYDDLFEVAADEAKITSRPVYPQRRRVGSEFMICHLHGFLPHGSRRSDARGDLSLSSSEIVLAEDDYHEIARDLTGWTSRELHRLFDEHHVLIFGMSLSDPNVRRVLANQSNISANVEPHSAAVKQILASDLKSQKFDNPSPEETSAANSVLRKFWEFHGVNLLNMPDYQTILPLIMRLRYESYGHRRGDLWREGAERGYGSVRPNAEKQKVASRFLSSSLEALRKDFSLEDAAEIGIFLLKPKCREEDPWKLELVFRSSENARLGRQFSADPDSPTGVAGRVFVFGDGVCVLREHELHDFGIVDPENPSVPYEGIVSVPITDWVNGGVPVGVVYATVSRANSSLFDLPMGRTSGTSRSASDLYAYLIEIASTLLNSMRADR